MEYLSLPLSGWFSLLPNDMKKYIILPLLDDVSRITLRHVLCRYKLSPYVKKRIWKQVFNYSLNFYLFFTNNVGNHQRAIRNSILKNNFCILVHLHQSGNKITTTDLIVAARFSNDTILKYVVDNREHWPYSQREWVLVGNKGFRIVGLLKFYNRYLVAKWLEDKNIADRGLNNLINI
jgi:hypothetical protein